jgi:hypothetical protein
MEFVDYKNIYDNFSLLMARNIIIFYNTLDVHTDFPSKLPKDNMDFLAHGSLKAMITIFPKYISKSNYDRIEKLTENPDISNDKRSNDKRSNEYYNFFLPHLLFSRPEFSKHKFIDEELALNLSNQHFNKIFESAIINQSLVMTFAYLEAFMVDSIRIICLRDPRILMNTKKKKSKEKEEDSSDSDGPKMKWSEIIKAENWDNLIGNIVEKHCFKFGMERIDEKFEYFSDHGINIELSGDEKNLISKYAEIRHIIVHNGAKVSQKYLDKAKRTDVKIGDIIVTTRDEVEEMFDLARLIGAKLFEEIAWKFFKKKI